MKPRHRARLEASTRASTTRRTRPTVVKVWRLPKDKDQQVAMTIRLMIGQTIEGAFHPALRHCAEYAALEARDRTVRELARAYTRFVHDRVRFRFDPEDIELVRKPGAMAQDILAGREVYGDCDDVSLLLGTMLFSRAVPVAYVTISTSPHNPEFRHVFVAARVGNVWERFDPSVSRDYDTRGLRHRIWPVPFGGGPPRFA